jgi:glycosyltransferase involved in cell wall biosynthesis
MNILQVIGTLDPRAGGPVEGLIQQGKEMNDRGHEVHTLTLDAPGLRVDPRIGSKAVYFLGPSWLTYGLNIRLEPWLRTHGRKYDVIIVHGMWQYHGYCVAKVARSLGLRYVIFLHGMLDPWFARTYPRKHLKKWLYWPWAEYRTLRDARLVLFTTAEELRLARESFWLYKVRERLVGYGIKPREIAPGVAREDFLAQFPHLRDTRNLVYLSRIHPKKGCDLLINAFAKVADTDPALHLVLAGPADAHWLAELQVLVHRHGLASRVTFTGMLTGRLKWGAYDAADVFVLPSHQENFGIVVAEALASRLPVLITYNVNIWNEIVKAKAGIVCADTQEGADELLTTWLAMPAAEREAMRKQAIVCFEQHFEVSRVTDYLITALQDVVSGELQGYTSHLPLEHTTP